MISVNPSTHEVLEDWEAEGVADQMLSDIYGTVTIAGYSYDTAYALEKVDPAAYWEAIDGLIDSMELVYE